MPICAECQREVNRVYLAVKMCSPCLRIRYRELNDGQMDYLQFRAAVTQLFGYRKHKEYADIFGITSGAFSMFWKGSKKISRPMKERLRKFYEDHSIVSIKKPTFLMLFDPYAKNPTRVLWPSTGLGHQLWLLINEEIPLSKAQFLMNFDRVALTCVQDMMNIKAEEQRAAWDNAPGIWNSLKDKRVMILDSEVAGIIGYPVINPEPYGVWREHKGVTFCRMPRRGLTAPYEEEHFGFVTRKLVEVYFDWLSPV